MCKLFISLFLRYLLVFQQNLVMSMVELRVTVDEKLNKLLDKIVEAGLYQSKAELMRSATIYLLVQMGLIKDHLYSKEKG